MVSVGAGSYNFVHLHAVIVNRSHFHVSMSVDRSRPSFVGYVTIQKFNSTMMVRCSAVLMCPLKGNTLFQ